MRKYILLLLTFLLLILIIKPQVKLPEIKTVSRIFPVNKMYLPLVANRTIQPRPPQTLIGYGIDWRETDYTTYENQLLNATWFHNWGIWPDKNYVNGLEFIQHLYCDDQFFMDNLKQLNGKQVLFLNEPDVHDQCNISPQQAVDALIIARRNCSTCVFIGAQVSHLDYFNDYSWLRGFMTELQSRNVQPPELGAFHIYTSSPEQAQNMVDSYFQVLSDYNFKGNVWITEIGGENPETVSKLGDICVKNSRIERCAYFSPKCDPNFSWWWFNQKYCLMDLTSNLNKRGLAWSTTTK